MSSILEPSNRFSSKFFQASRLSARPFLRFCASSLATCKRICTVTALCDVSFAHRPSLFKLVHMCLQEFWASWQLHQFFPLLQKFLHSFLLVLHQPAFGVSINQKYIFPALECLADLLSDTDITPIYWTVVCFFLAFIRCFQLKLWCWAENWKTCSVVPTASNWCELHWIVRIALLWMLWHRGMGLGEKAKCRLAHFVASNI